MSVVHGHRKDPQTNVLRSRRVRSKRLTIIIGFLSMALLIAAACTGDAPEGPRVPTPEFNPTPAGGAAATATTASEPTQAPAATTAPEPTQAPAASTGPAGSADNGETVFNASGCSACHSTGTNRVIGPGLAGVFERAESRGTGQTAEEYVFTAITDPGSFIVDGFPNAMPSTFGSTISEGDIQDLIAYLATLN